MTGFSWSETRTLPIVSSLRNTSRRFKTLADKGRRDDGVALSDEEVSALNADVKTIEQRIATRVADKDKRWHIHIKHIGEPGDARVNIIGAKDDKIRHRAAVRARKSIIEDYGVEGINDDRVMEYMLQDEVWIEDKAANGKTWLLEGLVDGEKAIKDIHEFGGPVLTVEAIEEVKAWQTVGWEQGEDSGRGSTKNSAGSTASSATPNQISSN